MNRQYTRAMDRFLTHEVQMTSKAIDHDKYEREKRDISPFVAGDIRVYLQAAVRVFAEPLVAALSTTMYDDTHDDGSRMGQEGQR